MRKLALILLAMVTVNVALLAPANAEIVWTNAGAARYASSREEAMERLPVALEALGIPEEVRRLLMQEVTRPCTRVHLTPGMRFPGMMTGGVHPHAMLDVVVGRNPVRFGIVQAMEACMWQVDYEGQRYRLFLPDVCNNWAWQRSPRPQENVSVEEPCTTVQIEVRAGDILSPAVLSRAALPPSRCWAQRQGGEWEAWPGGCIECIRWDPVLGRVPDTARQVRQEGRIEINRTGTLELRVPRTVETRYLAVYLVRDGLCSFGVIEPSDWQNHTFSLTENMWRWRPEGS